MFRKPIDKSEALSKMMMFCSTCERCASEIEEKLIKLELPPQEIAMVINQLYTKNFLNDNRFLTAYIRDKFTYNKWGKIKIKYQLKQKGFDDNTIENALEDTISTNEYLESLTNCLRKKNQTIKDEDKYKRKTKLLAFAQSKGFEISVIQKAIENIDLI